MSDAARLRRMARALRDSRTGAHADPAHSRAVIVDPSKAEQLSSDRRPLGHADGGHVHAVDAWAASDATRRAALRGFVERLVGVHSSVRSSAIDPRLKPPASSMPKAMRVSEARPALDTSAPGAGGATIEDRVSALPAIPLPAALSPRGAVPPGQRSHQPILRSPSKRTRAASAAPPMEDDDSQLYEARIKPTSIVISSTWRWPPGTPTSRRCPAGGSRPKRATTARSASFRLERLDEARAALLPFAAGSSAPIDKPNAGVCFR